MNKEILQEKKKNNVVEWINIISVWILIILVLIMFYYGYVTKVIYMVEVCNDVITTNTLNYSIIENIN